MYRKSQSKSANYSIDDYHALLKYITHLAHHKMGYPVSLLTFLGLIDNEILGIKPNSLANVLLNNVGDPFKDSDTSLMEVKRHEREVILLLEKYYGVSQGGVRGYVTTGGTEGNFASLWWSKRYLINMGINELIHHDDLIKLEMKEVNELTIALQKINLNDFKKRLQVFQKLLDLKNSIEKNKDIVQQLLTPAVFFAKGPTHYSVPKIAEILRLNIRSVSPNDDGSIDLKALHKELILHIGAHPYSPVLIIANIGTTVTGAVDDVPGIKKILDSLNKKINYTIHLDGALTGFVMPILKPFGDVENYFEGIGANTLAVSAHKFPGLSQPCGIILATQKFYDKAFEKSERNIEYVGNILDVTITGSRSGLNVLMFYNALLTLGFTKKYEKLIELINNNINNARYLYHHLVTLYGSQKVLYPFHFNVMFPKPSKKLSQKYQLMITKDIATICVLSNISKKLIDELIFDLTTEKENEYGEHNHHHRLLDSNITK